MDGFEVEGFDDSVIIEPTERKIFNCQMCAYTSPWAGNVKRHVKSQHQSQNVPETEPGVNMKHFICEFCGKQYNKKYSLSVHRKLKHLKTFRFICSRCDQGFMQLWAYRGHLAKHHKALKSKCDSCGKTFTYKINMLTHQKRCKFSASEPPTPDQHICSVCRASFMTVKNLRDHQKGQHEDRRFKCDGCGRTFKWRSSLAYHKKHVNHHYLQ